MLTLLLLFYVFFFAVTFVWPSWRIWQRDGINPLVLPSDDSALGLIGVWFKVIMAAVVCLTGALALGVPPSSLGGLTWLKHEAFTGIGTVFMLASLIWIVLAQAQMGRSWRIGIDRARETDLITSGVFGLSRNPIFLGLRINMLGLFLIMPNALSLAILVATEILIGVQVRLEEEHLHRMLGTTYADYQRRVRRWI